MIFDAWDIALRPGFLAMFALVLGGFLPMLGSIAVTWFANEEKERRAKRGE